MTTENLKVSAYLPKVVYDYFQKFKDENNFSFSQATIQIFAEYFGIDLSNYSTPKSTGGLLDRIEYLEKMVFSLIEKVEYLESTSRVPEHETNVNAVDFQSEPPITPLRSNLESELPSVLLQKEVLSEPFSNLRSELPNDLHEEKNNLLISSTPSEPEGKVNSLVLQNVEIIEAENNVNSNTLNGLSSEPDDFKGNIIKQPIFVDVSLLANRLGFKNSQSLQNKKVGLTKYDFTDWISKRDPDSIPWVYKKEGKKGFYYAPDDLSQEVKENLLNWISQNKP